MSSAPPGVDLFWLPLGAGGHSVRWNGRVYEAVCALLAHREAHPLFHSALRVGLPTGSWTIEMTPVWAVSGSSRGVVAEGPVGTRAAGRSRLFRYEVHCWREGVIADLDEAVGGPVHLSSLLDPGAAVGLVTACRGTPVPSVHRHAEPARRGPV